MIHSFKDDLWIMLSLTEQWHWLSTCLGAKHSTHPVMSADDLLARTHVTLAQKALLWQPNWGIRNSYWTNMTWPAGLSTNLAFLWRGPIHTRPSAACVRPSGLRSSSLWPCVQIQERDRVCDGAGDGDGDGLELLLHTRIAPHWCQLCCHYCPALATAANGSRTATRRWWQRTARYIYVNCFVFQLGRNSRSVAEVAIVCIWRVVCVFSVKLAFPYTNVMMHEEDAQSFTHQGFGCHVYFVLCFDDMWRRCVALQWCMRYMAEGGVKKSQDRVLIYFLLFFSSTRVSIH